MPQLLGLFGGLRDRRMGGGVCGEGKKGASERNRRWGGKAGTTTKRKGNSAAVEADADQAMHAMLNSGGSGRGQAGGGGGDRVYANSSRAHLATSTRLVRARFVSSQPRVFKPQSGFTNKLRPGASGAASGGVERSGDVLLLVREGLLERGEAVLHLLHRRDTRRVDVAVE